MNSQGNIISDDPSDGGECLVNFMTDEGLWNFMSVEGFVAINNKKNCEGR